MAMSVSRFDPEGTPSREVYGGVFLRTASPGDTARSHLGRISGSLLGEAR